MPENFIGYKTEIEKIEKAISKFSSASNMNIAIISEPYAGKTTLMDFIFKRYPGISTQITVPPNMDDLYVFENVTKGRFNQLVFVDDCHLLYRREVGGFEALESFLDVIATKPEHMFITSWNIFSWNYLSEVLHVEKHFPCRIFLPEFEVEDIRSVLMSQYNADDVVFESGTTSDIGSFLEFRTYPLKINKIDRTVNIPYPKINLSLLKEKIQHDTEEPTPEELALIKIKSISSGNILLSNIIWQKSLVDSTIKVDEIYSPSFDIEMDYDTKFLAYILLSMGCLSLDSLESTFGNEIDVIRSLAILQEHEIIRNKKGMFSISPEAIHYIESKAQNVRLI